MKYTAVTLHLIAESLTRLVRWLIQQFLSLFWRWVFSLPDTLRHRFLVQTSRIASLPTSPVVGFNVNLATVEVGRVQQAPIQISLLVGSTDQASSYAQQLIAFRAQERIASQLLDPRTSFRASGGW